MLVTSSPREVAEADRIVLPGVGAFADCRAGLYGVPGMVDTLQREVIERGKPFLGICVGMQLMATRGVEIRHPCRPRLDRKGDVVRIEPGLNAQGGRSKSRTWAGTSSLDLKPHPLLAGIAARDHAYFVHSFQLKATQPETVLASPTMAGRSPPSSAATTSPARIPPREEPGDRPAAHRQLPALETLSTRRASCLASQLAARRQGESGIDELALEDGDSRCGIAFLAFGQGDAAVDVGPDRRTGTSRATT